MRISDFDYDRFQDKYSDWNSNLNQDTKFNLHFTNDELEDHLSSQKVKDECEWLGITLEQYREKYIIKAEDNDEI